MREGWLRFPPFIPSRAGVEWGYGKIRVGDLPVTPHDSRAVALLLLPHHLCVELPHIGRAAGCPPAPEALVLPVRGRADPYRRRRRVRLPFPTTLVPLPKEPVRDRLGAPVFDPCRANFPPARLPRVAPRRLLCHRRPVRRRPADRPVRGQRLTLLDGRRSPALTPRPPLLIAALRPPSVHHWACALVAQNTHEINSSTLTL